MKFLVLYYSSIPAKERIRQASMDTMKAAMDEWIEWKERHGNALLDFGSPLKPAKKLEHSQVIEDVGWTTGFSIIQAETLDEAVEIMKDHPSFKDPTAPDIEILEYVTMPGM